jgi:hypothetical protein
MGTHQTERLASDLWHLVAEVHKLATGRELQIDEAMKYFGDPTHLASVVEQSGILDDPAKRQTFQMLLSEGCDGL